MAATIDARTAMRIAEMLDLFAELPSTPPVLCDEARQHAVTLLDALEEDNGATSRPGSSR
jgi:hypothetical protein